jgi:hypothetical protein
VDGSLRANRFGSVVTKHEDTDMAAMNPRRTAYVVALPDLPDGSGPAAAVEQLVVGLEHLALDWLDADAAPGEARLVGRHQRLIEQTADGELVARLLAELGVDPNAVASVYTPLTHAAEFGHLEAARLLLDSGADPCLMAGDGATPLMSAAGCGQLEVLRLLLGRGAAVDAVSPAYGTTAFHAACFYQPECAEELARAGCDVGVKDRYGRTGRETAERNGHRALVAWLDALGAEQSPGGGEAQAPVAKKKRKKRPKKKRTVAQPGSELEPEIEPEFEPEPELEPELELELELDSEPEPLLEPESVDDPVAEVLAGLGLLEHLPACRVREMDRGARPPTSGF